MSNTDFQSRIARLNEKHGPLAEQQQAEPEPVPSRNTASRGADRTIAM